MKIGLNRLTYTTQPNSSGFPSDVASSSFEAKIRTHHTEMLGTQGRSSRSGPKSLANPRHLYTRSPLFELSLLQQARPQIARGFDPRAKAAKTTETPRAQSHPTHPDRNSHQGLKSSATSDESRFKPTHVHQTQPTSSGFPFDVASNSFEAEIGTNHRDQISTQPRRTRKARPSEPR